MRVQKVHRSHVSTGTDACIHGSVVVEVKHVIDRGKNEVCSPQKEVAMMQREEGGGGRKIIVQGIQL